jgi:integrase
VTVYRPVDRDSFRYDFWYSGERYVGNTEQTTKTEAEIVEADRKKALRLRAGGLLPIEQDAAPTIEDWAEVYLDHVHRRRKDIKSKERIEHLLRVVLRFWGAKPSPQARGKFAAVAGEPYHDLRLDAPIRDPHWLLKFEDWMDAKRTAKTGTRLSGQTRNQYRSTLSQMYVLALRPEFRARSGVQMNPFLGIPRDRDVERTSTVTVTQLRAWLTHASYHVRLAVSIAALAPKLRLANVLALRWSEVDLARGLIIVHEHKTDQATGKPLVAPIVAQLRRILDDAKARGSKRHVVTFRGRALKGITDGVKAAAISAGLKYGRFGEDTITFHTIRHTMATMLAELGDVDGQAPLDPSVRKKAMGHKRLTTTDRYTHIRPAVETRALERLSQQLPIADLVTAERRRAVRTKPSPTVSPTKATQTVRQKRSTELR